MSTENRPTSTPPVDPQSQKPEPPADRPTVARILASALAAMTTTALLASLGVAGTIIGAAVASVVTVLANFFYTTSLSRTAEKVAAAAPVKKVRSRRGSVVAIRADAESTVSDVAATDNPIDDAIDDDAIDGSPSTPVQPERASWRAVLERVGGRRIVAAVAAAFVLILVAVTVVELMAGKPLTNVVRNQEGTGTTLFQRTETTDAPAPEEIAPTPGPSDVPTPDPVETVTPEPTESPTVAPVEPTAPATPVEEETPTPAETTAPPTPVEEETTAPEEDRGAIPPQAPSPAPSPTTPTG